MYVHHTECKGEITSIKGAEEAYPTIYGTSVTVTVPKRIQFCIWLGLTLILQLNVVFQSLIKCCGCSMTCNKGIVLLLALESNLQLRKRIFLMAHANNAICEFTSVIYLDAKQWSFLITGAFDFFPRGGEIDSLSSFPQSCGWTWTFLLSLLGGTVMRRIPQKYWTIKHHTTKHSV